MVDLIKEFRVTISNILLYPPESDLIKNSLAACSDNLSKALEGKKLLTISESEGKLLADGKPMDVSGGIFLDSLKDCKIKSIIFKPGFTKPELYNLLHDLSAKQRPKSSPHIEISEKSYVPVGERDLVIELEKEGVELEEKIVETTHTLSKLIDLVKDREIKEKIRLEVAKILGLKPEKEEKIEEEVKVKEEKKPAKLEVPPELSPIEETEKLLKADSRFLLDEGTLQRVGSLLQSLRSPRELELAGSLCDKIASNLEASIADVRLRTVLSFKRLYSTIETLGDKKIVRSVDFQLVSAGHRETNGEVYQEIISLLRGAATRYLKEGNYTDTHTITGMLSEHARSVEFEERRRHAKATIDKLVGSEFTRLLVDDLSSPDEHRREKAFSILLDIGEPCVPPLIAKIKETPDLRLRKAIADLLVKIGDPAVNQLIEEFKRETSVSEAMRIMDLLDGIGHEPLVVDALRRQLANPNFQLRRKAVDLLHQIGTEDAKKSLFEALDDESPIIKERAIEYLGNLQYSRAVPKLIKIIKKKEEKEPVQEEACRALGNIGDPSSIPALFKVASPKTLFYLGKPRAIRIAAIEALVKLGDSRAKEFTNDKDPFVRDTVKEMFKEQG